MTDRQLPTMREIARLAGVSKSTVSRALADDPRVNEKTKAKIKEIAGELNYRPNTMASGLARRRTNTLGLVIPMAPRSISDPFYLEFVGGIGDYAITRGFSLLLSTLYPHNSSTPGHVVMVEAKRVDGLILTEPMVNDERIRYLRRNGTPFVFLGDSGPDEDLLWVNGDNFGGAEMAVRHLMEQGHTHIGCISGPPELVHGRVRLEGYKAALKKAGLKVSRQLIIHADFTQDGGYRAMQLLLGRKAPLTAVFVANDLMAMGALRAVTEAGLTVPGDIAIAGFDGIHLAEYTNPPLTTVRQPIYRMGYLAAEMLIKTILNEPLPEKKVTLPLELVVRGSTQPLTEPARIPRTK